MVNNYKISIVINNYNYERFLRTAIESVLMQTVAPWEIIVVDDGSTDNSLALIALYKEKVKVISKANGGQASAFNAGYQQSSGDWIWFVDADDLLTPNAIKLAISAIESGVVKLHSPLLVVDRDGLQTGSLIPGPELSEGSVIQELIENGDYRWPPTTGNVFSRELMDAAMPIPEARYRLCADFYLCSFAAVFGKIKTIKEPVGFYRTHDSNSFHGFSFDTKRLYRQGEILINTVNRIEELVRLNTENHHYLYPYSRSVVEALILSHRFGSLMLPVRLKGLGKHKVWLGTRQFKTSGVKAKLIALAFWLSINYAPKVWAKKLVLKGVRKNEEYQKQGVLKPTAHAK
jgi:glycosyltransferase involved in cell wall biosynthesis